MPSNKTIQFRSLTTQLAFSLFIFSPGSHAMQPNAQEQVEQAATQLYRALSAKDSEGFSQFIPEQGFTEINPDWDGTRILNMTVFNAIFQSNAKIDLHIENLQVQMLDQLNAIVTGYRSGTITDGEGKQIASKLPLTMVWQRTNNFWKLKHVHLSKSH